jgi:peroxiredoxin
LSDPDKKAAKAFGVLHSSGTRSNRITIYVNQEGKIAFIDEDVKAGQDGANVAKRLAELKFAKKN